jgi:hypothetical protein
VPPRSTSAPPLQCATIPHAPGGRMFCCLQALCCRTLRELHARFGKLCNPKSPSLLLKEVAGRAMEPMEQGVPPSASLLEGAVVRTPASRLRWSATRREGAAACGDEPDRRPAPCPHSRTRSPSSAVCGAALLPRMPLRLGCRATVETLQHSTAQWSAGGQPRASYTSRPHMRCSVHTHMRQLRQVRQLLTPSGRTPVQRTTHRCCCSCGSSSAA